MSCSILGIDCATDPKKRGVAFASFEQGSCTLGRVAAGMTDRQIAELVVEARQKNNWVLLALDAPLGWPDPLGTSLADHHAGQPLSPPANSLFRRETDRFIKTTFGKQPLDVGADRIARTAHAALSLLAIISHALGAAVPLAWSPDLSDVTAIEVYPAATLIAYGLSDSGYKGHPERAKRQNIIDKLPAGLVIEDHEPLLANADILDAVLCVLAAMDFLQGNVHSPVNQALAHKEGWIWVRHSAAAVPA